VPLRQHPDLQALDVVGTLLVTSNEQASVNLAAELLGHTDPKVTAEHYIRRNEHVNPLTAELLDAAFAPNTDLLD
jgi:hypothetical protein